MLTVSAAAGSDYTTTSSTLEFSTSGNMQCIFVNITDDGDFEQDETFTVMLTVLTSGVTLGDDTCNVTITDNEGKCAIHRWLISKQNGVTIVVLNVI